MRALFDEFELAPPQFAMIGNSLRSDIAPVLAARRMGRAHALPRDLGARSRSRRRARCAARARVAQASELPAAVADIARAAALVRPEWPLARAGTVRRPLIGASHRRHTGPHRGEPRGETRPCRHCRRCSHLPCSRRASVSARCCRRPRSAQDDVTAGAWSMSPTSCCAAASLTTAMATTATQDRLIVAARSLRAPDLLPRRRPPLERRSPSRRSPSAIRIAAYYPPIYGYGDGYDRTARRREVQQHGNCTVTYYDPQLRPARCQTLRPRDP